MEIQLIPLDDIDAAALVRDRVNLDPGELFELRTSIATHGLRMPVEVFPIEGPQPWGLISGSRRLAAFLDLRELNRERWAAIPAFVRQVATVTDAIVAMVEENAIRSEISPWEQAMVAVAGDRHAIFGSIDEAVETLYKSLSRQRQHRVRSVALVAEELDGLLTAPETLSQRQLLRLAAALTRNYGDLMRHALDEASDKAPESQWRVLLPILVESETTEPVEPAPAFGRPPRPHRTMILRYNLRIRREMTRDGWCLHFTGREATGMLIDAIFEDIERNYARTEPPEPSPHRSWREMRALGAAMFPPKPEAEQ